MLNLNSGIVNWFSTFVPKINLLQKRVIISVINDIATDQRVKRSAVTLQELGYEVIIVGRQLKNSLPVNYPGITIKRFRFLFNTGFVFYAIYNIRLFFYLLLTDADLLFSNDLDTLLPNYFAAKIKAVPLVYDSHEYFTGVPELESRPFVKGVWQSVERATFPNLKYTITVNDSIAELYNKDYGVKPVIVRNVPVAFELQGLNANEVKTKYSLPVDKRIIILQGSGINVHRGAEEAVLAMKYVSDAVLLIIGGGDVFEFIPKLVKESNLENIVILHGKVAADELRKITASCFVGLTLDKGTNINYRYSLPNKLFDYIQAEIPVIASDLVEVKKIVQKYKVGLITSSDKPEAIAEVINKIIADDKLYAELKANTKFAAKELCWEKEKEKLVTLLSGIHI